MLRHYRLLALPSTAVPVAKSANFLPRPLSRPPRPMRGALFLTRRGTFFLVGLAEMSVGQRQAVTIIDIVGKRLSFGGKFPVRRSWPFWPGSQRVENVVPRRI